MAKISDEIRKWCADLDSDDILCTTATLYTLADRIDRELVELPKDAHGEYIRVGDTLDGYGKTIEAAYGPVDDLAAENAKLRELVRVFYHCTTSGVCDECPVNGGGAVHLMPDTICDTMHDRMRELGVDA